MSYIPTIIKAFIIGATMLVPGLSGGSMAVVLSLYDKLVFAVSNIYKDKKNILFLIIFSVSALIGMFLVSKGLLSVIDKYPVISRFFFIGIVLGSIPSIYKESKIEKIKLKYILFFILGIIIVLSLSFLPEGLFNSSTSITGIIIQFIGGIISCIGFLLPGISFSYLLLVMGLYENIVSAISSFDILNLLPFILGFILGFIMLIKVLEKLFIKYNEITYSLILGFLIGSVYQIIPSLPKGREIVFSIITFAFGIGIMYVITKFNNKSKEID